MPTAVLNVLNFNKKATVIARTMQPRTRGYAGGELGPTKAETMSRVVAGWIAAMRMLLVVLRMKAPLITRISKLHASKAPRANSLMLG